MTLKIYQSLYIYHHTTIKTINQAKGFSDYMKITLITKFLNRFGKRAVKKDSKEL